MSNCIHVDLFYYLFFYLLSVLLLSDNVVFVFKIKTVV